MKKFPTRGRGDVAAAKTFAGLFGALLGLSLLKFGNPVVVEKFVAPPENFYDWLVSAWPLAIGYWLFLPVAVLGLLVAGGKIGAPKWLLALPLIWLGWQFLSATATVDAALTRGTLIHFTTCVAAFYLGYFSLGDKTFAGHRSFWLGLLGAFIVVLASGFQQHFGGLEESRRYFMVYVYPQWKTMPAEFWTRMVNGRIFSTLFYPNALAGALLLLLPAALVVLWRAGKNWPPAIQRGVVAAIGAAALACLYWSGSKGGWLLMLLLGLIAALWLPLPLRFKVALAAAVLVIGAAGFALKYSDYFKKGATSVNARFDCWRAALQIVETKPWLGNGPGTFGVAYAKIKRPDAEMARLTHNDYLEQASDSGIIGFAVYLTFFAWALIWSWRRLAVKMDAELLAVWLGLLGWSLQESFEFGLYIPALAWTAFGLLGLLLKRLE